MIGESISPGYDCSDILNQNTDAKDGFYWIHLNDKSTRKVWCDMTTDGGGFMLFGFLNSPVTWKVPSNNVSVDPFGSSRWSSVLGNAPILDFRVQISTSKDFNNTKSHWSFRLNKKRLLKNLMVMGEKGCDSNSPGIGDIKYVKDLITNKIVSTSFRCSKFGIAYHRGTKFGWANMNSCLQTPCRSGYAFVNDHPIQVDYYGSFSYRKGGTISGTAHNATAFIGCDKGKCCACYGPVGGTNDYCTDRCRSVNGGTVTKNVFVRFWVRSTLPKKRVVMEFKGRCNKELPLSKVNFTILQLERKLSQEKNEIVKRVNSTILQLERKLSQEENEVVLKRVNSIDSQVLQLQLRINKLEENHPLKIRLKNGANKWIEGRVEMYHPLHDWGTVCDDGWDINDGHVVCRQLGYEKAVAVYSEAHYGEGTGKILLDFLQCTGNESHLWDCPYLSGLVDSCSHSEDAGVKCSSGSSPKIRLSGITRGRVEVYHPSKGWGTVCDDFFDINDGHVVCRQLGYKKATAVYKGAHYGPGTGHILLDNVKCAGKEAYLWDCPHNGWDKDDCMHSEDASVDCQK